MYSDRYRELVCFKVPVRIQEQRIAIDCAVPKAIYRARMMWVAPITPEREKRARHG
jgi:hypothetical protein